MAQALRQAIRARQDIGLPWQNNSDRPTMTDERAVAINLVAFKLPLSTLLTLAVLSEPTYFQQACIKN